MNLKESKWLARHDDWSISHAILTDRCCEDIEGHVPHGGPSFNLLKVSRQISGCSLSIARIKYTIRDGESPAIE